MNNTVEDVWIRAMRQEDVPAVLEIERSVHEFPWTEQIFRDCIQVGYATWVLENPQGLLGFAVSSTAVLECHILNISIAPHAQHQGYGRRLMQHILNEARNESVVRVFLEVRISNAPAIALYKQLGFTQIAVRKNYYPATNGREDAFVLSMPLQQSNTETL